MSKPKTRREIAADLAAQLEGMLMRLASAPQEGYVRRAFVISVEDIDGLGHSMHVDGVELEDREPGILVDAIKAAAK